MAKLCINIYKSSLAACSKTIFSTVLLLNLCDNISQENQDLLQLSYTFNITHKASFYLLCTPPDSQTALLARRAITHAKPPAH